ncbi:MAG TPA: SMI1/KNR4 family protein [Polyangium sp.]|nr:SMI1/KNR4 family protein [Polyangium sp.]
MEIENPNRYGPTSREAITEFEARWEVVLPLEYKQFLLKSNGGRPTATCFAIPGFHGQGSMMNSFYGIHHGAEHHQLDLAVKSYGERIPADLIPIAADAGGNEICIGWKGKRAGKIYFWDHEDELDENGDFVQDYRNVFLVANSLQEFLDNLMTLEDFEKKYP